MNESNEYITQFIKTICINVIPTSIKRIKNPTRSIVHFKIYIERFTLNPIMKRIL